jgi:hypothetical protein
VISSICFLAASTRDFELVVIFCGTGVLHAHGSCGPT